MDTDQMANAPVVMLDLDGVVLLPRFRADIEQRALLRGGHPADDHEFPWLKRGAPADLERITVPGLNGNPVYGVVRRSVLDGLRVLSGRGTRFVWATTWLIAPDRLAHVATVLELDFVELPELGNIVPFNQALLYNNDAHWKTALVRRFATQTRVLWIDDQLQPTQATFAGSQLSVIAPNTLFGMVPAHLDLISAWTQGDTVTVFANQENRGWDHPGVDAHLRS